MKQFIFLLLAVTLTVSCATTIPITDANRTVNDFCYNSGSVSWDYVYSYPAKDSALVRQWLQTKFVVKRETDKSVVGESKQAALPIEEAGLDRMSTIMLFGHPCVVYFTAFFKEDRYRVKVNDIIWHPQIAVTTYGVTQGAGTMTLNQLALRNGGYNSSFVNTSSAQLDWLLQYMFTPVIVTVQDDDNNW